MDPLATLLSAYLTSAATGISNQSIKNMNLEVQAVTVEHQGYSIAFTHQQWKIKEASVCYTHRDHLLAFAGCTQAAQALFAKVCTELQATSWNDSRYPSVKRMYCDAAISYHPTQASLHWAEPTDARSNATEECRLAQAGLLVENTPETRQHRKAACGAVTQESGDSLRP